MYVQSILKPCRGAHCASAMTTQRGLAGGQNVCPYGEAGRHSNYWRAGVETRPYENPVIASQDARRRLCAAIQTPHWV